MHGQPREIEILGTSRSITENENEPAYSYMFYDYMVEHVNAYLAYDFVSSYNVLDYSYDYMWDLEMLYKL